MKFRNTFAAITFVAVAVGAVFMAEQAVAEGAQPSRDMMFVDLLYVQPGVGDAQVEEYFSRIAPIVAKHGLMRIGSFKVTQKMGGSIEPHYLNLWAVAGAETFKSIFEDEEYTKNIPLRNSIFDMARAHMFMLSPTHTLKALLKAK